MEKRILVIGGSGLLGQPVSRCLQEAGFEIRIMTRDLQKARENFDRSFQLFDGNPTDTDCLEEALNGCYGVHISLPTEVEQQVAESVAKLAARHDIQRISYISGATVAEEHRWFEMVNRKFLAEQAIRQSGIPYTFFCPTWVMDILPRFINQGRAAVCGRQPCPYHWVAARDIASVRRALAGPRSTDPSPAAASAVGGDAAAPFVAPGTDTFSCTAIWAGVDRKITSHAFRGGDYTAIMGGGSVDLRDARPVPGGAVAEVFVVMGGIDILVPEDWHVVNQVHVLMGAVEERRHTAPPEVGHVLYLRGTVIMGGVEVKN